MDIQSLSQDIKGIKFDHGQYIMDFAHIYTNTHQWVHLVGRKKYSHVWPSVTEVTRTTSQYREEGNRPISVDQLKHKPNAAIYSGHAFHLCVLSRKYVSLQLFLNIYFLFENELSRDQSL